GVLLLEPTAVDEPPLPLPLQLPRHQPVLRVDGVVLPACPARLVLGPLQRLPPVAGAPPPRPPPPLRPPPGPLPPPPPPPAPAPAGRRPRGGAPPTRGPPAGGEGPGPGGPPYSCLSASQA